MIGIDTDEEGIKTAIAVHKPIVSGGIGDLPPHFKFLHGDAKELDQIEEVPEEVDVVVMRHPQFVYDETEDAYEKWTTILRQSLDRLSEKGIVFITTYNEADRDLVRAAAGELGCQIKVDEESKWSRNAEESEYSPPKDKHVIILMK